MKRARNSRKGSILISTLWIMSILTVLAIGIGFRAALDLRLSKYNTDRMHARYLALSLLAMAEDLIIKNASAAYDSIHECGMASASMDKLESSGRELAGSVGGSFKVTVIDEDRKLNINIFKNKAGNIIEVKRMIKALSDNFTDDTVNSIVDWEDKDSNVLPGGSEDDYYVRLEHPYKCKNGDLDFIDELLLVKGVDRRVFESVKDDITIYGAGAININTAPEKVLRAVLDQDGKYGALVDKIVSYRKGGDAADGTVDDEYFTDPGADVVSKTDLTVPESARLAAMSGYLAVRSDVFRVTVEAKVGLASRKVDCVIERTPGGKDSGGRIYIHET